MAAPVRWPCVPSARTVALATTSEPGSKLASSSPSRPRPLSPERTPRTIRSSTRSLSAAVSVSRYAPASADDRHAHLDPLVLGIGGLGYELLRRVDRGREFSGCDGHQPPFFAFTASVSLGRILFRSPTTPTTAQSQIGAFGSLLSARMFSELCIPTLCWREPEKRGARSRRTR